MGPDALQVHRTVVAEPGEEHFSNCVWCRTADGPRLVAWGDRIIAMPPEEHVRARTVVSAADEQSYSNGGCAFDLDGDGEDELVVAHTFRPGHEPEGNVLRLLWYDPAPEGAWTEHVFGSVPQGSGWSSPHDIRPLRMDVEGEPVLGCVIIFERRRLAWYEIADDPADEWVRHEIAHLSTGSQSGLSVGDVAGEGRPDVVCGMFWAQCPPDPRDEWTVRRYGRFDRTEKGGMAKTAVADLNGDGRAEIIASQAEIPDARLGVFSRGESLDEWECAIIDEGLYAPHSVVVTDLDGDGRPDIVVGEMECGGWDFPRIDNPRIIGYLNRGDLQFERVTLLEHAGIHEMGLAPTDGPPMLFGCNEIQPQKLSGMETTVYCVTIERA